MRADALQSRAKDLAELRALLARFTPEFAAAATGIEAAAIRALAREFAAAPSAACYGRMGVSTQRSARCASGLIQLLMLLTGNLDRAGGALPAIPP